MAIREGMANRWKEAGGTLAEAGLGDTWPLFIMVRSTFIGEIVLGEVAPFEYIVELSS